MFDTHKRANKQKEWIHHKYALLIWNRGKFPFAVGIDFIHFLSPWKQFISTIYWKITYYLFTASVLEVKATHKLAWFRTQREKAKKKLLRQS